MKNSFSNSNAMPWYRWIFLQSDELPGVTLYFLSRRNSTSPRFFPLYENTSLVRIVLVQGSRLPYLDFLYLRFLRLLLRTFRRSFSRYEYFFLLDIPTSSLIATNQILHIDDPSYSNDELNLIKSWELNVRSNGFDSKIVVTTNYMMSYFQNSQVESEIQVISQGFSSSNNAPRVEVSKDLSSFKLVYISPYIDCLGDPHAGHPMWDASVLIDQIWTQVSHLRGIELHLIGRVGRSAGRKLQQPNVFQYGFMSIAEVSAILSDFDLALYPRTHDNRWQPQKIIEYLGAGVPILAFELVDTKLIEDLAVGVVVENTAQFIAKIRELSLNRILLQEYKGNCISKRYEYSWTYLGQKLDKILDNSVGS